MTKDGCFRAYSQRDERAKGPVDSCLEGLDCVGNVLAIKSRGEWQRATQHDVTLNHLPLRRWLSTS